MRADTEDNIWQERHLTIRQHYTHHTVKARAQLPYL